MDLNVLMNDKYAKATVFCNSQPFVALNMLAFKPHWCPCKTTPERFKLLFVSLELLKAQYLVVI